MNEINNINFTEKQKVEDAYALNMCNVSLTQIMDYNDPYILEQEYDSILNNINMEKININIVYLCRVFILLEYIIKKNILQLNVLSNKEGKIY